MLGEIDYGTIIIDSFHKRNEETGAPLLPSPETSIVLLCVFALLITVLLMNLLVSIVCKHILVPRAFSKGPGNEDDVKTPERSLSRRWAAVLAKITWYTKGEFMRVVLRLTINTSS